jgi:hypothetical protein
MAARVGRVTFLRVLVVEAPRGEWEDWWVGVVERWAVGWVVDFLLLVWRTGRFGHFVAVV